MIETDDYWIVGGNKFIFKPEFNYEINGLQYELISKCDTLMFSNYSDYKMYEETKNEYDLKYREKYIS